LVVRKRTKLNREEIIMIRVIFFGCLMMLLVLTSCASDTETVRYYKLGLVQNISEDNILTEVNEINDITERPLILIEPIILADFLRQQGLVIQKTDHQLQISNVHRWAENLESASSRIIRNHLENQLSDYRFENKNGRWKQKPKFRLSIELAEFQINNRENKVVASGQFWIFNKGGGLVSKDSFLIEESLSRNGYEHAISKLEVALARLSKLIGDVIHGQT